MEYAVFLLEVRLGEDELESLPAAEREEILRFCRDFLAEKLGLKISGRLPEGELREMLERVEESLRRGSDFPPGLWVEYLDPEDGFLQLSSDCDEFRESTIENALKDMIRAVRERFGVDLSGRARFSTVTWGSIAGDLTSSLEAVEVEAAEAGAERVKG